MQFARLCLANQIITSDCIYNYTEFGIIKSRIKYGEFAIFKIWIIDFNEKKTSLALSMPVREIFCHFNNLYYERHSPEPNGSEQTKYLSFRLLFLVRKIW